VHKIFIGKPEDNTHRSQGLGTDGNLTLKRIQRKGLETVDWIHLAQDGDR
jgi:hypothetical protein